tara:strand:- start:624 stop:806 length:183 start_codon:yes stop_codon:yes gene_type:complete
LNDVVGAYSYINIPVSSPPFISGLDPDMKRYVASHKKPSDAVGTEQDMNILISSPPIRPY